MSRRRRRRRLQFPDVFPTSWISLLPFSIPKPFPTPFWPSFVGRVVFGGFWLIVAASASSCRLLFCSVLFVGLAKIMRIRCGFSFALFRILRPSSFFRLLICLFVAVVVAFTFKQFHLQAATNFCFYYFRCQLLFVHSPLFSFLSFSFLSFPFFFGSLDIWPRGNNNK